MIAEAGDGGGRETDPKHEQAPLSLPDATGREGLDESLYLARHAVERAPELIQWIEPDGRFAYVNEAHTTLLGYTRAELEGMYLWDLDRSLTPELFREQWREIKAQGPRLEETVLTAKDGSEHPVEVASIHTLLPGKECGIAFARDISDRKRAEEILERAQFSLDHIGDYPLWLDRDGRIIEVSGSTCRHLEYSREELLQMTIFDIDPSTWDAAAGRPAEDMARLWDDAKELQNLIIETKHRTKTGREFPVEVSVTFVWFGGSLHQCSFCRDISIRKGLAQSLQVAQVSLEQAPDLIHWSDESGRVVYANEATCRFLGYTKQEIESLYLWDLDPNLSPTEYRERLEATDDLGAVFRHETALRGKDGQSHNVEITGTWVDLEGKKLAVTFARDVTERKRLEESLLLTQLTVDRAPFMVHWVDAAGRLVCVNQETADALGYTREELLARYLWDIVPGMTPEIYAERWRQNKAAQVVHREGHLLTKDGRQLSLEISISHVELEGTALQVSFVRDVTERKRLEKSLRLAQYSIDRAGDMVYWLGRDGRFVYANEAACRARGYSLEELKQLHVWDINPRMSADGWPEGWRIIKEGGARTIETVEVGSDGREYPVEVTSQHLEFEGEEYGVSINRDISERKLAEQSLKDSEERYRQLFELEADALILWEDGSRRILEVNQAAVDLYGYSREQLLTMRDVQLFADPDHVAPPPEDGSIGAPLFWHRKKDGTRFPVEVRGRRFEWRGRVVHLVAARDVTERRRIEESLLLTQRSVDQAADMIHWVDSDGRIVYANQSLAGHLGYTPEELRSLHLWDIAEAVTPELYAREWSQGLDQEPARHEDSMRRKDGSLIEVEVVSSAVEIEGRRLGAHIARDISERKLAEQSLKDSEERYRQLFELESDAHLLIDDDDYAILEANEAAVELYGYSRGELLGLTILDLSNEPELTRAVNRLPTMEVSLRWHRKKDGSIFPIEGRSRKFDWKGRPVHVVALRDISERKRTEESLLLIQHAVEQAGDMIYWLDPEGRVLYANQATCDLLGYSPDEITQFWIWELVPGGTQEKFRENWQAILDRGSTLGEDAWVGRDGRIHAVEISSNHFVYEGRRYGVSFAREIGERKEAEQALRDSEERYRQLFELESDALVLAADDSRDILEVNQATVSLYGFSRAELLAMKDTDLFATPAEVKLVTSRSVLDTALHYHRKKDGTVFSVEVRGRHFEWKGRPVHVAAIRDITERKQAEDELEESRRMLRLVLDSVPLRIAWRDRDLRYMGCNIAIALDARLPDTGAIVGLRDDDLPFRNTTPESIRDDLEVISSGVPKLNYDETIRTSEGPPRVMRSSKVPLRDRADNIIGVLGIHEDVTERVRTLEALRDREEQLRQSQKMEAVGRLAGGIAHDFNNVLTTIIGYSDLMLASDEFDPVQVKEDLSEIKAAAERASNLTRQILAFSRRQSLQPQVLLLNTVIAQTERLLTRTIGADVELRTVLSPELGLVEVDEHQFVQILLNLAVNARDAMPDGGALTLETKNVELDEEFCRTNPDAHPGHYIVLEVSDTGIGMDAETAAHVFEPFYTTKAPGVGTGLGLSTVYGVVTQSGGAIALQSEPGKGSVFSIYLPRFDHPAVKPADGTPGPETAVERPTVMVVDDDATFRALTVRILEKRGYRVLPVGDGDRAVELLRNRDTSIDLLLTDIVLPGSLQGGQIGQMAASLRPRLPVLYMSAYTRDTLVQAGRIEEDAEFLEKPFTSEYLASRIREMLNQPPGGSRPAGA